MSEVQYLCMYVTVQYSSLETICSCTYRSIWYHEANNRYPFLQLARIEMFK
jgi:hypothetical protein